VGRLLPGDVVFFNAPDGAQFQVVVQSVSDDGTTLVGLVPPSDADAEYAVTVHHSIGDDQLFPALGFSVTVN
jgi:hypothetical protein